MCERKATETANKAYFPILNVLHKIDFEAVPSLHLFHSLNQLSKRNKAVIVKSEIQLKNLYFDSPGKNDAVTNLYKRSQCIYKTSVLASLGELGRYPLMLSCCVQMIQY